MLLDKKRGLQSRATPASKLSSSYVTLDEGFRLFSNDLDKLQQFVEVNQTAFSKILKKVLTYPAVRDLVQKLTSGSGTKHQRCTKALNPPLSENVLMPC